MTAKSISVLPPVSEEQRRVIEAVVVHGNHVKVDAVAGSGKTTTILHLAKALSYRESLLVLTYNSKLKSETRQRCLDVGIQNIEVHTYHSAALNIYGDVDCSRDEGLAKLLRHHSRRPLARFSKKFDVIVIDEAQDMTELYFSIVSRLLMDVCKTDARIVVLGDARQSIYGFKGADTRFLTLADHLPFMGTLNRPWAHHTLSTTYRLAPALSRFINAQLLDNTCVLQSVGEGKTGKVRYIRCNTFQDLPFQEVIGWLKQGLDESDIFILAPTIKTSSKHSPLRKLENRLVQRGVPCYATSSDDERLDEDVTRGKIVFATFHQVKGLERKAVLMFNFDASYHIYFDKEDSHGCPNPIYVAATRAMSHLTVLQDSKHPPLRTVQVTHLFNDCEVLTDRSPYKGALCKRTSDKLDTSRDMSVTELLKHQKQETLFEALCCLDVRPQTKPSRDVSTSLLCKVETHDNLWENVSAITGTAVPCMFEYSSNRRCTLLDKAFKAANNLPSADKAKLIRLYHASLTPLESKVLTTADFLFIANVHLTLTGGFTHKLRQIKNYDWIDDAEIQRMMLIMSQHVLGASGEVDYEVPASMQFDVQGVRHKVKLACSLDCVDSRNKKTFEIKCVSRITTEHILQTALNAMLFEQCSPAHTQGSFQHALLNLCDGELLGIFLDCECSGVIEATKILLDAKYKDAAAINDEMFLTSLTHQHACDGDVTSPYTRFNTDHTPFGFYAFCDDIDA